jgi:hypothetical protein
MDPDFDLILIPPSKEKNEFFFKWYAGAGEEKNPQTDATISQSKNKKKTDKNGAATTSSSANDIKPAKSKADAVEVAPIRPSKQQPHQRVELPQKENQKPAVSDAEDFPTLGNIGRHICSVGIFLSLIAMAKWEIKRAMELTGFFCGSGSACFKLLFFPNTGITGSQYFCP